MTADNGLSPHRRGPSCGRSGSGSGSGAVPDRLLGFDLIRVCSPDCDAHNGCENAGKRPVYSVDDVRPNDEIAGWISNGGNVGVVTTDDLLVLDIDSEEFRGLADDHLPTTFTVRSGSGGEHRYYRCSWSENRKFGPLGSIRASNWQVVIPPSRHPSGNRYRVSDDRRIASVDESSIHRLIDAAAADRSADRSAGRQHAGGGCVGGSGSDRRASIPADYPGRDADWTTLKDWLDSNGLLYIISQTSSTDWSGDEFVVAKCLAEGGFSVESICSVLDRTNHRSKWHQRDNKYRSDTVQNAIVSACNDEFVDFDHAYKPSGERRKTEDGESGGTAPETPDTGGETPMSADYTDLEEVTVLEGSEEGDSFKKVCLTERAENGETVEYVSIKKGRIETANTTDGEEVTIERITDSTSIGSPEYLGDLVAGLDELDEQLNGSD